MTVLQLNLGRISGYGLDSACPWGTVVNTVMNVLVLSDPGPFLAMSCSLSVLTITKLHEVFHPAIIVKSVVQGQPLRMRILVQRIDGKYLSDMLGWKDHFVCLSVCHFILYTVQNI